MNVKNIQSYIDEKLLELFDIKDNFTLLWRIHTKDLIYVIANRNGVKEIYWFDQATDFDSEFITVKRFNTGDGRDALNWLVGDLAINEITHGDTCKVTDIYEYEFQPNGCNNLPFEKMIFSYTPQEQSKVS